jgi:tetratricopeptide (TPR) repeat protein
MKMVEFKQEIEKAKALFKSQDYEETEKIYRNLIAELKTVSNPEPELQIEINQGMGDCLREQLYFEEAVPYYENILKLSKANKRALTGMADSYRGLKDWDKAMEYWFEVLKIDPNDYLITTRIADAYRKKSDFLNAEKYYLMSLELNQKNKFALMGLGDLYYKSKKYNKALEYWKQLLDINPKFINILTMVGNIYRTWNQYDKAIDYYQKALEIDRNNFYALYGIADSLRGKKRFRDAIKYWKKILSKEPNNDRILTRLGDCYIKIGKIDEAKVIYEQVLAGGVNKYSMIGLVRVFMFQKNWKDGGALALDYLTKYPNDPRVVVLLGKIHTENGEKEKASAVFEKYANLFTDMNDFTVKMAAISIEAFQNEAEDFSDEAHEEH